RKPPPHGRRPPPRPLLRRGPDPDLQRRLLLPRPHRAVRARGRNGPPGDDDRRPARPAAAASAATVGDGALALPGLTADGAPSPGVPTAVQVAGPPAGDAI